MDREAFKQAFIELAEEMERQCGDWQNQPDTEAKRNFRDGYNSAISDLIKLTEALIDK